jgi:2-keto-4-pentenoate hydratase/2-oxohepta-3-ene-1,7-dioic acid hydratase in catechol pathway
MKICTYKMHTKIGTFSRLGILQQETIIDPNLVFRSHYEKKGYFNSSERADFKMPAQLSKLLSLSDSPLVLLQESLELYKKLKTQGDHEACEIALKDTSLACPLDKINVYRDFFVHEKHVKKGFEKRGEEIPAPWFEMPVYYKGATAGFMGPGEEILWPSYTQALDYELELGMIIAKDGKNIKEEKAFDHIFGFTILNDVSARDIQKKEMMVRLGPAKGKDFCSVMGPVIVTADEFNNKEPDLLMQAFINGDKWSEGRSSEGRFSFAQMMAHASKDEWLIAGDFFGSGTVGTGCGLELDKWIKPGDEIELRVEKIGSLKNKVGLPQKG